MKKYIQSKISELQYLYPDKTIDIVNGFIGVQNGERLQHTSYLGNAYFMLDGVIYTDYNCKNESKKLITVYNAETPTP